MSVHELAAHVSSPSPRLWTGWLLLLLFASTGAATAGPRVSVRSDSVLVEGLTPGATVDLRGLVREWVGIGSRVSAVAIRLQDDDLDGAESYTSASGIPSESIWLAIDPVLGMSDPTAPPEKDVLEVILDPARAISDGPDGAQRLVLEGFSDLEVYLFQPGSGLFEGSASDGGIRDGDAVNDGVLRIELRALVSAADGSLALGTVDAGARIVGVSPRSLTVFAFEWPLLASEGGAR